MKTFHLLYTYIMFLQGLSCTNRLVTNQSKKSSQVPIYYNTLQYSRQTQEETCLQHVYLLEKICKLYILCSIEKVRELKLFRVAYIPDKNKLSLSACYYSKPQSDKKYLRPAKILSDRKVERTRRQGRRVSTVVITALTARRKYNMEPHYWISNWASKPDPLITLNAAYPSSIKPVRVGQSMTGHWAADVHSDSFYHCMLVANMSARPSGENNNVNEYKRAKGERLSLKR